MPSAKSKPAPNQCCVGPTGQPSGLVAAKITSPRLLAKDLKSLKYSIYSILPCYVSIAMLRSYTFSFTRDKSLLVVVVFDAENATNKETQGDRGSQTEVEIASEEFFY